MQDEAPDMTGMPSHVRASMEAALKLEKEADAQQRPQPAQQEPSAAADSQPATADQPATGEPQGEPGAGTDENAPETLKAKIAALEAQVTDQRNRLRRHHGQQKASRDQMETTVKNLQDQIKRLEEERAAAPAANDDDAVLLRNGFTKEDIEEMSEGEKRRTARITRKTEEIQRTALSQREDIDRRLLASQSAGRISAADAAIEAARPGFLAAIKPDADTAADWELFSSDVNPDSDAGWTWKETLANARKLGDRATVIRIADMFAQDAGISFSAAPAGQSAPSGYTRLDIPPRRVMPSSGPAAPSAGSAYPRADAEPPGQRYPRSYEEEFMARSAPLRGGTFRPFTVNRGGRMRTFTTEKAMERERDLLLSAADEGRIDMRA